MKKLFYISFFVLLSFSQGVAQNIDSLKFALKNAKDDTTRCIVLNMLAETASDKEWPLFNEQLKVLAEKNSKTNTPLKTFYLKHLSAALHNISVSYDIKGDLPKALEYLHKSLQLQKKIKDKEGIALSLSNIGYIYKRQNNIPKALDYYIKSLRLSEELNNKYRISITLNNIGFFYNNQGDIPKALEYYHKSLKLSEDLKDKSGIAYSLNNIGDIYNNQDNLPKALEYLHKSLHLQEELEDKVGIALSLNNIGVIYRNQGNIPKALEYLQKSLMLRKEIKDKSGVANSLNNIGGIYKNHGDPSVISSKEASLRSGQTKALEYFHKSLQLNEEIKDKAGIAASLCYIADAMLKKGMVVGALNYATRSLQTAKELGYPWDINYAASNLKDIYKKQNKYKEALEMYELEIQMSDSMNNETTKKASIQKQFQYEYEKKAAADSVVFAKENEIKEVEIARQKAEIKVKQNQQLALYGGLVLVLVFAGFMYNRFKVTQKQKTVIEQQKATVEKAHVLLEEKNSEIVASIRYAKRIQDALITSHKYIERNIVRLKTTNKN